MGTLNSGMPAPAQRFPRASIMLAGTALQGWKTVEVINNPGHYVSDQFVICLPIFGQPDGFGFPYYSDLDSADVTISAGFLGSDGTLAGLTQLIAGAVDNIEIDAGKGEARLIGRDYSGALIETRINEQEYINLTSSQAANLIVSHHPGLVGQVTATTTPIGIYYNDQSTRIALKQNATEWDFLTELADREGFRVYMQGKTLVFGPVSAPDTSNPYILNAGMTNAKPPFAANFERLKLQRALTIARDIIVTVHSSDPLSGTAVSQSFKALNPVKGSRAGSANPPPQLYDVNIPGLTSDQAYQRAQALARQISQHERVIEVDLAGDPLFASSPPPVIQLTGTGTAWDQIYFLDRATHKLDFEGGYCTTLRAKNSSTGTQFQVTQQ